MPQSLTFGEVVPIEVCNLYHFFPGTSVFYFSTVPQSFAQLEECIQEAIKEECSSVFVPVDGDERMIEAVSAFAREEGLKVITSFAAKQNAKKVLKHFDALLIRGATDDDWHRIRTMVREHSAWFEIMLLNHGSVAPVFQALGDRVPVHGISERNSIFSYSYTKEKPHTVCPTCRHAVVSRNEFGVLSSKIRRGACMCGEKIPGVWE